MINFEYKKGEKKMDNTDMDQKIERYIGKHTFPSFDWCKEELEKYDPKINYTRYQYIISKKIYENIWNERKVVTYGRLLHDVTGVKGLSTCCLLMNIIFDNASWRVMQNYGRKLEFLFQGVTPEWEA